MFISKCCIKIHIEPELLRYEVIYLNKNKSHKENQTIAYYSYQNFNDVEKFINELKKSLPRQTVFELYLAENTIQSAELEQPKIKLKSEELTLYVEASIYELFEIPAQDIYFDFSYTTNQSYIIVSICNRHDINEWLNLFKKHKLKLNFIGRLINEEKINFLPWRQNKLKTHKVSLILVVISIIGISNGLLCYLWQQTQTELNHYLLLNSKQQKIKKELTEQISTFIPNLSISQKQLYQTLLLLSKQLPSVIWLDSLEYQINRVIIKGNSLQYIDIINFSHAILKFTDIIKCRILQVWTNKNHLSFEMEIEFNE